MHRTQLRKMQKQPCFVRHFFVLSETAYAGIQRDQPIMRPLVTGILLACQHGHLSSSVLVRAVD